MTVEVKAAEMFSWGTEGETTMGENESTPAAQMVSSPAIATSPSEAVQLADVPEVSQLPADAATAEPGPTAVESAVNNSLNC